MFSEDCREVAEVEVERAPELVGARPVELELTGEDARCVHALAIRLGLRPERVVRLALTLLARRRSGEVGP